MRARNIRTRTSKPMGHVPDVLVLMYAATHGRNAHEEYGSVHPYILYFTYLQRQCCNSLHVLTGVCLQKNQAGPAEDCNIISQEDVSREIKAHHTAIRAQLQTHNSAVLLHMEQETKEKEFLRTKVDEQLNTVDAYLTQVDQKVDRILERVVDAPHRHVNGGTGLAQVPVRGWRSHAKTFWAGCRTLAQTQRFQIAAAGLFVGLLIAIVLILSLMLSWAPAPAFLTAAVTPLTVPRGPGYPGLIMIDVRLVIDRASQVYYVLLPSGAVDTPGAEISDPSAFEIYMTAEQVAETQLSRSAHACGTFDVPVARKNFTFTVAPAVDTAECREYTSSADRAGLDQWAAAHRCARCPTLQSDAAYKVRLKHLNRSLCCA